MEILDPREPCFEVDEDFLNFTLEPETELTVSEGASTLSIPAAAREALAVPFTESGEEELEWLSNKDAFPAVETYFGILSDNPALLMNHQSPVSVLESNSNSSSSNSNGGGSIASCCDSFKVPTKYPVRARTNKRRRRIVFGDLVNHHSPLTDHVNVKTNKEFGFAIARVRSNSGSIGRKCQHCQTDKTPQWRAGPMGPKTLCNACGVRYKSGRLLPEYRPANSPTFSSIIHSNSHRKVVEMRRKKQLMTGQVTEVDAG